MGIFKKKGKIIFEKDVSRYQEEELEVGKHIDNFIALISTGALIFILKNSGREEIFNLRFDQMNEIAIALFVVAIISSLLNRTILFEETSNRVKKYYEKITTKNSEGGVAIEDRGVWSFFGALTHYVAIGAVVAGVVIGLVAILKFY